MAETGDVHDSIRATVRDWAKGSEPVARLRAEPEHGWRALWPELASLGLLSIAVPESRGGGGGSYLDLAVALQALAEELVPGPILDTVALIHGLAGHADALGAVRYAALVAGTRTGSVAAEATLPLRLEQGLVSGRALVQGPEGCLALVPVDDGRGSWALLDADAPGATVEPRPALDITVPLAELGLDRVAPVLLLDADDAAALLLLRATLASAAAAGVARRTVTMAAEHARLRVQFGQPIGSFQAVKHLCAEMHCRAESAVAVAHDAAAALDDGADPADAAFAVSIAVQVAIASAVENGKDCIQVLGGIGFTWEHDAHLCLRRGLALRQLLGAADDWAARTARHARAGARRPLAVELAEVEPLRAELRRDIESIARLPADRVRGALADAGLVAPGLSRPYGRGAGVKEQLLIADELARAGVPVPDLGIGAWALATIMEHGTPEQVDRLVPGTLRGDVVWCQLFSEPEAGSDLASLRTGAEPVDGGWLLRGQKVWTSLAREATHGLCLARTDPAAPKHVGISFFVVDMASSGIDVRPLREITGDALFNEVFLDDVPVRQADVVGEVDHGWRVARTTLSSERVEMGGSRFSPLLEELLTDPAGADPVGVGGLVAQAHVVRLLAHRSLLARASGTPTGPEAAVQKLLGVRHVQELSEYRLARQGVGGLTSTDESREFLSRRAWSIAGGSTQIVLTLIGERLLGLPR